MKKIAIFCDGTWNELKSTYPTNVVGLAKCVAKSADDRSTLQIVFYDDGVGVASNISFLIDSGVRLLGGALGHGLNTKIEQFYRVLALNYEPGDDIYIFGFSRGAYTARSLCGLIRKCGIVRRDQLGSVPLALQIYRSGVHPDDPSVVEFRKQSAYPLASGRGDYEKMGLEKSRRERSVPEGNLEHLYQYRPDKTYRMMYLGVWDTVGSLGVPARFGMLSKLFNRKYQFHDLKASSLISSLRHAVSVDENRRSFEVSRVENIFELNKEWAGIAGWDTEHQGPRYVPYPFRPYQQRWFPGDHGSVGGGNPELGLSSAALLWIAEGAQWAGLNLNWSDPGNALGVAERMQNPHAPLRVRKDGSVKRRKERDIIGVMGGYGGRRGPCDLQDASESSWHRWTQDPGYRPPTLGALRRLGAPFLKLTAAEIPAGFPRVSTRDLRSEIG